MIISAKLVLNKSLMCKVEALENIKILTGCTEVNREEKLHLY